MKRYVFLCISVIIMLWTGNLFAQRYRIASDDVLFKPTVTLSKGIYMPGNAEDYTSLRLASFGDGLKGIVSDDLTDYFRNPAFVYMSEKRTYYLDFDRQGSSNDLRISMFTPFLIGKVGISFSGDAVESSVTNNQSDPGLDLFDDTEYSSSRFSKSSFSTHNFHLWWANKVSGNLKYGLNYIRKSSSSDNSRTDLSTRLRNRTDVFYQSTSVDSQVNYYSRDFESEVNVNTFRGGIIIGSTENMVLDLVFMAEFSDKVSDALADRNRFNMSSYIRPDYSRLTENADTSSNVFNSNDNSTAYGLELNIKKKLNDRDVQSYLLSFDRHNFDISDNLIEKEIKMASYIRDSLFSISDQSIISDQISDREDATAYVLKVGLGREINLENALMGLGISATRSNGTWKTISSGMSTGFKVDSTNDTTFQEILSADLATTTNTDITSTLISFPIGGEFYVSEKVSLRLGIEFNAIFNNNKLTSSSGSVLSNSEKHFYGNSKSFGIGYKHSDKFRADLMASSDLSRISLWRISIQYGL